MSKPPRRPSVDKECSIDGCTNRVQTIKKCSKACDDCRKEIKRLYAKKVFAGKLKIVEVKYARPKTTFLTMSTIQSMTPKQIEDCDLRNYQISEAVRCES